MAERIDQITEERFDAAWQGLVSELKPPDIEPGEYTAQMLADASGVSRSSASNKLLTLERSGKMTSRYVRVPGATKALKAYRFRTLEQNAHSHTAQSRRLRVSETRKQTG